MNKKTTYIYVANPDNLFGVMLYQSFEMQNLDKTNREPIPQRKETRHESVKTTWVRDTLAFGQRLRGIFRTPRKRLKLIASVSGLKKT
ncbi:MAG: hypothetical protein JKY51_07780 [Opitutaceae bacterium]|nr:hypothetical protein [Opitutaceae bacterium]